MTPPTMISPAKGEAKQLVLGARLLIVVSGLYVASFLARGVFIDPAREQARFAQTMAEPRALIAALLYLGALALHVIAAMALTQFARRDAPQEATLGLLVTAFGLVLAAAVVGPSVYVHPQIASAYLHGNVQAVEIAARSAGTLYLGSVLLQGFLVTIGGGFLALALVKSKVPRWVGGVYAVSALLYTTPVLGFAAELLGAVLVAIAGAALLMNRGVNGPG